MARMAPANMNGVEGQTDTSKLCLGQRSRHAIKPIKLSPAANAAQVSMSSWWAVKDIARAFQTGRRSWHDGYGLTRPVVVDTPIRRNYVPARF